jgi:hypothetical protein
MGRLIACLGVMFLLVPAAPAAAGEIRTGGIPAFGDEILQCTGVNLTGGEQVIRLEILGSSGTELWFANCNRVRPGGLCQTYFDPTGPDNSITAYSCRIIGTGVIATKLRGTLSNRNTGVSSDAR